MRIIKYQNPNDSKRRVVVKPTTKIDNNNTIALLQALSAYRIYREITERRGQIFA